MKKFVFFILISTFMGCSSKTGQSDQKPSQTETQSIPQNSAIATSSKTESEKTSRSDVKGPLEIGLDYPDKLVKGKSYSAKINYRANREIQIISVDYQFPENYKGTKPANDKTSRMMKSASQAENTIPFSIQNDMKDGYLVVTVTYVFNDQIMKTSSSIRLFSDDYLDRGKDMKIRENDGSTTNLKVLQN